MATTAQYGTAIYGDSLYGAITLSCASGSYTLTGGSASFLRGRAIAAANGTYDITGVSAGGIYDQVVFAANGAYVITASDANLVYSQRIECLSGSYTLTGSDADLRYAQPDQQVQTRGGIGKKPKTVITKSQSDEIQAIVRKALDKLEGIDNDIISEVKSEIQQDIQQIDLTHFDLALAQVRLMVLMAENRIKMLDDLRAEDEDEAALLMLL